MNAREKERSETTHLSHHLNMPHEFDSVETLYSALSSCEEAHGKAELLLGLRSWLTTVVNFDPVTGDVLYTSIDEFMDIVEKAGNKAILKAEKKDRVYRIVNHVKEALPAILQHTRDRILRTHTMMPIYAAREVDIKSVQWLSRKPGRTLREKLADKPYIKAVQRVHTLDSSENRLLKAFILRLEQILNERQSALSAAESGEECEDMLTLIQQWLRTDDAEEIGRWENLSPNNTLLQDKHYRKIWDGWMWIQSLDYYIERDCRRIGTDFLQSVFWNTLSLLNKTGLFRFPQQPLTIDYDDFLIHPALAISACFLPGERKEKMLNEEPLSILHDAVAGEIIHFVLQENGFDIVWGDPKLEIRLDADQIVIYKCTAKTEAQFDLELSSLNVVVKAIFLLLFDTSFRFSTVKVGDQQQKVEANETILDLCSVRPVYVSDSMAPNTFPFKLLRQYWFEEDMTLDCGDSKAVFLRSDVETLSMRSLLNCNTNLNDAVKSKAAMFFAKKISDVIQTKKLCYLTPDWGNEFELEYIRKSVNFYFPDSLPLPQSIAAVFAWHSSESFAQHRVQDNDFVLVLDVFYGGLSITPIQAVYNKELHDALPASEGITWERHPVFIHENNEFYPALCRSATFSDCKDTETMVGLFGYDGLKSEGGAISFVDNEGWSHLPNYVHGTRNQKLNAGAINSKMTNECIQSLGIDLTHARLFILPLQSVIQKGAIDARSCWLGAEWSPIMGGQVLEKWQKEAESISLWRDHLPELSIKIVMPDGYFDDFFLVKNATVTPKRGKAVAIPVERLFTLPAGQAQYKFPLQQGKGKRELRFVAYLKSPSFPLKEDTGCRLEMNYTYGADDPYELKFIPLESGQSRISSIGVEWRSTVDEPMIDIGEWPVPVFPPRKTWSNVQEYPNRGGGGTQNLLKNIEKELMWLRSVKKHGRTTANITKDWKQNAKGVMYCFANNVYISEYRFDMSEEHGLPVESDLISFYVVEDHGSLFGRNATIAGELPKKFFSPKFRFSLFTVFNDEHSFFESDVPGDFRETITEAIDNAISILASDVPQILKDELILFLACLHKHAPRVAVEQLLTRVGDVSIFTNYYKDIAYAIGGAALEWQIELLNKVVDFCNIRKRNLIAMETLAIAFWRSKELIFKLTESQLRTIIESLCTCLGAPQSKLLSKRDDFAVARFCRFLELLLALLRTRESKDKQIKKMLGPNQEITKKFIELLDKISKFIIINKIQLNSRINLQIDKPEMFRDVPDLLYVLRMYLSCDSGANAISISGVNEGE
jgi:hypothetical protein